jgi:hypothetical protein
MRIVVDNDVLTAAVRLAIGHVRFTTSDVVSRSLVQRWLTQALLNLNHHLLTGGSVARRVASTCATATTCPAFAMLESPACRHNRKHRSHETPHRPHPNSRQP